MSNISPTSASSPEARWASITTNDGGTTLWRLPLATTVNDIPLAEGALLFGGIGAGTAITLLTIAHAVLNGGRRRKRDLRSIVADNQDDPQLANEFERIYASDNNWCGLRLTCELAAKAGAPLDDEERMMLSYFKGVVSAEDLQEMSTPQLYYSYASFLGFSHGSVDKCKEIYSRCPYSAKKMMRVYRTAHSRSIQKRQQLLQPSYTL
ncbi:uncharacterized protein [Macrobrachium rosenbergii]|uniref:uncharacterized protein n=1 Tax=Macrobrachium rosenbergii TaxID=79674 RepID=UPI0034D4C569